MKTTNSKIGKIHWLLTALMMTVTLFAAAQNPYPPYDFKQANADGDTLYYRITSSTAPYTVAVTRCHDSVYHTLPFPTAAFEVGMPGFVYPVYDYDSLVVIPASVTHNGVTYAVTSIDNEAFFMQKGLGTVILPATIDTIFNSAFACSSLKHIEMPAVRFVDDYAFYSTDLNSVSLPSLMSWLGYGAFCNSNLQSVEIPGSVKVLPGLCFDSCPLQKIILHEGLERVEREAFDCLLVDTLVFPSTLSYLALSPENPYYSEYTTFSLSCVEIADGSTPLELGGWCFARFSNLHSITLPNRVTKLGEYCFANCGLESIVIPPAVQSIPEFCFYQCDSLHHVQLPDGLEQIDNSAFRICGMLQEVTIPSGVQSIGFWAFLSGPSNRIFNMLCEVPPVIEQSAMGNAAHDTILFRIPCHTTADYQNASGWSPYASSANVTFSEQCTGVAERDPETIALYPNPVGEVLSVESSSDNISRVELYDMFGKLVLSLSAEATSMDINVANLPAGLYLLQLTFPNGEQATRKVVKN